LLAANQTQSESFSRTNTYQGNLSLFFWQINPKKFPLSLFYFFGEKEKEINGAAQNRY
jgi:hypothetical protein